MDTVWHLEELMFRGRPAGSDLPTTYQVTLQERSTLADGRSILVREAVCTPEEATALGFPPDAIKAWIDTGLSADLTAARETIATLTADRDAQVAALEACQRERDGLAANLEDLQAKAVAARTAARDAARAAAAQAAQDQAAEAARALQDQVLTAARQAVAEQAATSPPA